MYLIHYNIKFLWEKLIFEYDSNNNNNMNKIINKLQVKISMDLIHIKTLRHLRGLNHWLYDMWYNIKFILYEI